MQSIGLDGSVFKGFGSGKSPFEFGAVKFGTGLLNWGMGMGQRRITRQTVVNCQHRFTWLPFRVNGLLATTVVHTSGVWLSKAC